MAKHLPSTEKLLGEFLRDKPYTHKGMWQAAERFGHYVKEHDLGDIEILEYPGDINGESTKTYPLVKILSQFGMQSTRHELMTWLGHLDVVDPLQTHLENDPLTVENEQQNGMDTPIGKGRGALDMWAGNIAYLKALQILKEQGETRCTIQTVLPSLEEANSAVLYQAIQDQRIQAAKIGATTEILVDDPGRNSPMYCARRGRVGLDVEIRGEKAPHSGAADRHPEDCDVTAPRFVGRALDEAFDSERGFVLQNKHPQDEWQLLPDISRAQLQSIQGKGKGLSLLSQVAMHFDIFTSDPDLAPETIRTTFEDFLVNQAKLTKGQHVKVRLENRNGIPYIDPYLIRPDDPWVEFSHKQAQAIAPSVELAGANGVAEEGMVHQLQGTKFVGWSPDGADAHEEEWVDIDSIQKRAEWLAALASKIETFE